MIKDFNTPLNVVMVAGYGFSGSGAVHDILKEFSGHHYYSCEFTLLARPDGLIDLENGLVNDWSPWKSDLAIERFKKIIRILGREKKEKISLFSPPAKNYNRRFTENFTRISEDFVNRLVSLKYRGKWSGRNWEMCPCRWTVRRLKKNLLKKKPDFEINITGPKEDFIPVAKEYLNELFRDSLREKEEKKISIVLDLATYHCRPQRMFKYFDRPKMILVDRDPRDNFVEVKRSLLKNSTVEDFIKWYRIMRSNDREYQKDNNVLKINFEELIDNYEKTLSQIYSFLKISPGDHIYKKRFFRPEESAKNRGLWKKWRYPNEINKIRQELEEYCRD